MGSIKETVICDEKQFYQLFDLFLAKLPNLWGDVSEDDDGYLII